MTQKKNKAGFTLIELSIVLVIIGLISGSIFVGRSLIRQSQINSAISDEQRYVQAVSSFQQKYGALPGDLSTATSYWTAGGTCPSTYAAPLTSITTCNGDGNGQIATALSAGTTIAATGEAFLFWQHLALSQMVQGSFNGSPGSAGSADHVLGTNCPRTKIYGGCFGALWIGIVTSGSGGTLYPSNTYPANNLGHTMIMGGYSSNNIPVAAILTGPEGYNIDSKFDDGVPSTGNILTWLTTASSTYANTCATSATAYSTTVSSNVCSLIFVTGF